MKQLKTIEQLQILFPKVKGLEVALLYGSFGRNEATPNSDIDIQLVVNPEFEEVLFLDELKKEFHEDIQSIQRVALRSKLVVFFQAQPKIEFVLLTHLSGIDIHYLGSEISDVARTILFEKQPSILGIEEYLNTLREENAEKIRDSGNETQVLDLIDKFLYEFEGCSTMHRRGDGYQFYFFYNIALQAAIQLNHLSKGHRKLNFLPKHFISNNLAKEEQEPLYQLKGTLFLPEANQQKRRLLEFFYSTIENLVGKEKQAELKQFCEWVYDRDFFWNFRDISTHNPKIQSGKVFRTATMTPFQNESRLGTLLGEKKISTVIDLRADREIEEQPYSEHTLARFKYVKAPFDPWNQPGWFTQHHHQGTNGEIAYRFFAIGCNDNIKKAMEAILEEENGAVAIHCFAGKDRTGILISLLHLLVESPIEIIHADYLASEVDVKLSRLNLVLDIVQEKGGIEPYLVSTGLTITQIVQLKQKLICLWGTLPVRGLRLVPVACCSDNEPVEQPESMVPPIELVAEFTQVVLDVCA